MINKFESTVSKREVFDFGSDAEVTVNSSDLKIPLRDNHVIYKNNKAPIKKTLLIFGDSHSSIGINPQLTYIATNYFSHVEFIWNPFCVHGVKLKNLSLQNYDYILFETAQRFSNPSC